MNRAHYLLATLSLVGLGCASSAVTEPHAPSTAATANDTQSAARNAAEVAAAAPEGARSVGDFVVFKLSGTGHAQPLTLTERVIAREGDTLVVDVTADDGATKRELRVRFSDAEKNRNEVLSVATLQNGAETATTIAAYEALAFGLTADTNEALLGSEDVKVAVGKETLDAKRTSFRVRVGKKHATLRTLESPSFAWGDLGGEITTDGGKVLYKAEVVDAGRAGAATATAKTTATPAAAAIATDE